ncbi:hypothetical protein ABZS29_25735 [Kribbella sp. NPDC005582]|uniref:hypothetical protein n=1 Tax=Kribbella sp. NPDC005582 TaxID=3156893 RepID=UPI0033B6C995
MFSAGTRRLALTVAVVLAVLPLQSCGEPTAAEIAAVKGWIGKAGQLDDPIKGTIRGGDDVFRTTNKSLTKTMDELPPPEQIKKMSPELQAEVQAAAARVRARITFYNGVNTVTTAMAAKRVSAVQEIAELINYTRREVLTDDAKDAIWDFGKDVLQETACELAWRYYMRDDERQVVTNHLNAGTVKLSYVDQIPNPDEMRSGVLLNAIASAARSRFAPAMAWQEYAEGLRDKADKLTQDGAEVVTHPDGGDITFALLYFIGGCLNPPAS